MDISNFDLRLAASRTRTPEEAEQEKKDAEEYELAYQKYANLVLAYNQVISLEDDPTRRALLESLLGDLHEENK